MNCKCCFEDEQNIQLPMENDFKSKSHQGLLGSYSLSNLLRAPGKQDYQKISLKRKTTSMRLMQTLHQNKFSSINTNQISHQKVLPANSQNLSQKKFIQNNNYITSFQRIQNNMKNWSINPSQISLPTKHPPPLQHSQAIRTTVYQPKVINTPALIVKKYSKPNVIINYESASHLVKKPVSNETTHTSRPVQNKITEATEVHQIQPIKIQIEVPTATRIDSNEKEKINTKFRKNSALRKSSIEFNYRDFQKNQEFKGKMSIELKKIKSVEKQLEQKNSMNLIKSARSREQHIYDMRCIKTQSIKGQNDNEEDSIDGLSEVIKQDKDSPDNYLTKLMTNSETKFQKLNEKHQIENKRSIIWQTSRKQSLSEF